MLPSSNVAINNDNNKPIRYTIPLKSELNTEDNAKNDTNIKGAKRKNK